MDHLLDDSSKVQVCQPVLLILPDEESKCKSEPVLGQLPIQRLVSSAQQAGFATVLLAPGTHVVSAGARELATGEPIAKPALVVYESVYISPFLLHRLATQTIKRDEYFSFYDRLGRPVFWYTGYLRSAPNVMPITEELAWPEVYGAQSKDVERGLERDDQERMAEQILQDEGIFAHKLSLWQRYMDLPMVRFFVRHRRLCIHGPAMALACVMSSGGIALFDAWLGYALGALLLLVGVQLGSICEMARKLCFASSISTPVLRFLGRASLTAALTYRLMIETDRTILDTVLIFGIGVLVVVFFLIRARALIRNQAPALVEIAYAKLMIPERFRIPLGSELLVFVLALTSYPLLPWLVFVVLGLLYLWRWFASPATPSAVEMPKNSKIELG